VFPHFDQDGMCGYEIRNANFKGYSSGGSEALWLSQEFPNDERLVLCESAIDALSHAQLFGDHEKTRYASIGGQVNLAVQPELIRAAAVRMPAGSEIIAAFDADAAGARLAGIVRKAVELSGRADLSFTMQEPFGFKDWNDQLRVKHAHSFPAARPKEPSVA